jgi:hypothetical protein
MSSLVIPVLDPRLPGIAHLDSYGPCRFLADLRDLSQWTSSWTSLLSKPRTQSWLWSIVSPRWPISPLVPIDHGRRNNLVDSGGDCSATWIPWGNCVRQRPSICIQVLAAPIRAPWSQHLAILSFPPWDRWTNRTNKPNTWAIPPLHYELPIGRLADPAISSRVCL